MRSPACLGRWALAVGATACVLWGCGPDPRGVLEQASSACAQTKQVSYDFRYEGQGSLAGEFTGRVRLLRQDDLHRWVSIAGATGAGDEQARIELTIASDERTVHAVDGIRQIYSYGTNTAAGGAHLLAFARYATPFPFAQPDPFSVELEGERLEWEGSATIHGVACDVIRTTSRSARGAAEVSWYIGGVDRLPRAMKWVETTPGVDGSFWLELDNLDTETDLDRTDFTLEAPPGYPRIDEDRRIVDVGAAAPDWSLRTPEGQAVTLSQLRGNVVVLGFWASWCPPCWALMPELDRLARSYPEQPVRFFGIDSWESPEVDPREFMKKNRISYDLLLRGESAAWAYKIASLPALFVIDRQGSIVFVRNPVTGDPARTATELRAAIDAALAARTG